MAMFIAVCEANGFAPAARRLAVSPSVVTRQIARLEERLGVRLLHRTTRAVRLTDAGQRYLQRARQILADVEEAELSAQSEKSEPQGRLAVTAPLIFGRMHVAPVLARLTQRFPRLAVELHLSDRISNLVEEGHDAAIRIGHLPDSQLIARRLGETRRVLVGSPGYLRTAGRPKHPSDLSRWNLIAFSALAPTTDWPFQENGAETRVRVAPRYVTNSGDAAITQALDGGGLTFALCYQVKDAVAQGHLKEVLKDFSLPPVPISAVYPSSRLLSSKVRALVDEIGRADWRLL